MNKLYFVNFNGLQTTGSDSEEDLLYLQALDLGVSFRCEGV